MSWWDSPDLLNRYYTASQVLMIVCGVITLAATAFTVVARIRLGTLQAIASRQLDERVRTAESFNVELRQTLEESQRRQEDAAARQAEAEIKLREFEQRQRWRILSEEQRKIIVDLLTPLAGSEVVVGYGASNAEARGFATALKAALDEAGWLTGILYNQLDLVRVGVVVRVKNPDQPPPHADALLEALRAAKIPAVGEAVHNDQLPSVTLLVGAREE